MNFDSATWTGRRPYMGISRGWIEHKYYAWRRRVVDDVSHKGIAKVYGTTLLTIFINLKGAKAFTTVYVGKSWVRGGHSIGWTGKYEFRTASLDWYGQLYRMGNA
jgi:hypothetical protein